MNPMVVAAECRDEKKGVLFLDITVFVMCLCAVALGVLLSHVLERRRIVLKKQEN